MRDLIFLALYRIEILIKICKAVFKLLLFDLFV